MSTVAEFQEEKEGKNVLLLIFLITNFGLWLLKFQEENIGIKKCIVADFLITNYGC